MLNPYQPPATETASKRKRRPLVVYLQVLIIFVMLSAMIVRRTPILTDYQDVQMAARVAIDVAGVTLLSMYALQFLLKLFRKRGTHDQPV